MNDERRSQIERRGEILARVCEKTLMSDPANEIASAGFKWGYLLCEGPKKYAQAFGAGDLTIASHELERALFDFESYLPGEGYLCWDEREILEYHNQQCQRWMNSHQQPLIEVCPAN